IGTGGRLYDGIQRLPLGLLYAGRICVPVWYLRIDHHPLFGGMAAAPAIYPWPFLFGCRAGSDLVCLEVYRRRLLYDMAEGHVAQDAGRPTDGIWLEGAFAPGPGQSLFDRPVY